MYPLFHTRISTCWTTGLNYSELSCKMVQENWNLEPDYHVNLCPSCARVMHFSSAFHFYLNWCNLCIKFNFYSGSRERKSVSQRSRMSTRIESGLTIWYTSSWQTVAIGTEPHLQISCSWLLVQLNFAESAHSIAFQPSSLWSCDVTPYIKLVRLSNHT